MQTQWQERNEGVKKMETVQNKGSIITMLNNTLLSRLLLGLHTGLGRLPHQHCKQKHDEQLALALQRLVVM
jgi:hypothetical protein